MSCDVVSRNSQHHHGHPAGDVDREGTEPCRLSRPYGQVRTVVDDPQAQRPPQRGVSLQTGEPRVQSDLAKCISNCGSRSGSSCDIELISISISMFIVPSRSLSLHRVYFIYDYTTGDMDGSNILYPHCTTYNLYLYIHDVYLSTFKQYICTAINSIAYSDTTPKTTGYRGSAVADKTMIWSRRIQSSNQLHSISFVRSFIPRCRRSKS